MTIVSSQCRSTILWITTLISLSACVTPQIIRPVVPNSADSTAVLVFRESAFNSGLAALYFGENGNIYLALENGQYGVVPIAPGNHRFTVGAKATQDYRLDVLLTPGSRTCIKTYADPANYGKALIPLLMNFTAAFKMDVVSCPDEGTFQDYLRVEP